MGDVKMVASRRWLPQIYQRFQPFWDRAVPAAGLSLLLWTLAIATATFSDEWRLFLTTGLLILGLVRPAFAYVAFTFLIAYPLYTISIYFAAIILAVLILTSHWAMRNLGATVLVLATPALLPLHTAAAVPLLAGLWWGELTGALAGGLAALWLKLLAGMAGQPLELARLSGWTPAGTDIVQQFSGYNSLQTLLGLVNPFQTTSQLLLLHVLQVMTWGLAGYIAGLLALRTWSDRWRGWAPLSSALPAGAVIGISYLLLPQLLGQVRAESAPRPQDLALWTLASAVSAAVVRFFYLYLRRPVLRLPRRSAAQPKASEPVRVGPSGSNSQQRPPVNWKPTPRSQRAAETDDDVIMLEID